jgi:hypothetical protein
MRFNWYCWMFWINGYAIASGGFQFGAPLCDGNRVNRDLLRLFPDLQMEAFQEKLSKHGSVQDSPALRHFCFCIDLEQF